MNIFDFLNGMTVEKKSFDFEDREISKSYDTYMINRWISMVDFYIPLVNEINKHEVPKNVHYQFYLNVLPKRKQYFDYIKKTKDLAITEKKYIADYFEVGMREADAYIKLLTDEQINQIIELYKYGKDQIIDV